MAAAVTGFGGAGHRHRRYRRDPAHGHAPSPPQEPTAFCPASISWSGCRPAGSSRSWKAIRWRRRRGRTRRPHIKEVPAGRVSPQLVRQIPVGAVLAIEGPFGYFTWTEADGGPLALVGAGSGMVPLMAIIRYAAARQLNVPVRLLCSSAGRDHAIYHDRLAVLAASHPWLEVTHTFTRDPHDTYARYHRRIDATMLAETFASIADTCQAYVCGPPRHGQGRRGRHGRRRGRHRAAQHRRMGLKAPPSDLGPATQERG